MIKKLVFILLVIVFVWGCKKDENPIDDLLSMQNSWKIIKYEHPNSNGNEVRYDEKGNPVETHNGMGSWYFTFGDKIVVAEADPNHQGIGSTSRYYFNDLGYVYQNTWEYKNGGYINTFYEYYDDGYLKKKTRYNDEYTYYYTDGNCTSINIGDSCIFKMSYYSEIIESRNIMDNSLVEPWENSYFHFFGKLNKNAVKEVKHGPSFNYTLKYTYILDEKKRIIEQISGPDSLGHHLIYHYK